MKEIITFKEFERYINAIHTIINVDNKIDEISKYVSSESGSEFNLFFPSLVAETIELLEKVTGDKDGWVEYYVFELDFGSNSDKLQIRDFDDNIIPPNTVKDLWNIIKTNQEGCD